MTHKMWWRGKCVNLVCGIWIFLAFLAAVPTQTLAANDYYYKNSIPNNRSTPDKWNFIIGECTSYVAWCLNSRNQIPFNNRYLGVSWGHARNWGNAARSKGIPVDGNPSVGCVGYTTSGTYGHVVYVTAVNGGSVYIEEYSGSTHRFSEGWKNKSNYAGFIHFPMPNVNPGPEPSYQAALRNSTYTVQNAGTGYFMNYGCGMADKSFIMSRPDGSPEQKFTLEHTGSGKYELHINHPDGGVMNVDSNIPVAAGKLITRFNDNNNDTQRFFLTPVGGGRYLIQSAANKDLVVAPDNGEWHARLRLTNYQPSDAKQFWIFTDIVPQQQDEPQKPNISDNPQTPGASNTDQQDKPQKSDTSDSPQTSKASYANKSGQENRRPDGRTGNKTVSKKIQTLILSGAKYKVANGIAEFVKPRKNASNVVIPSYITVNGKKIAVTSIAANAFKNNKKVKKITIGKNVTSIGKRAFYATTKLEIVKISSKKIRTVGASAWRKAGYKNRLKLTAPRARRKAYKKLFGRCGLSKKIQIR